MTDELRILIDRLHEYAEEMESLTQQIEDLQIQRCAIECQRALLEDDIEDIRAERSSV